MSAERDSIALNDDRGGGVLHTESVSQLLRTNWRDLSRFHNAQLPAGEQAYGQPHPALAGKVVAYEGYDGEHHQVARHLVPVATISAILDFATPLRVPGDEYPDPACHRLRSPVIGLHTGPIDYVQHGRDHGIVIALTPLGAYSLFGIPLREITNISVQLHELLGSRADQLIGRLVDTRSWPERFALLDSYLLSWLETGATPSPITEYAWRRLVESAGRATIADLATEVGRTRRQLSNLAQREIGLPLKAIARVLRFQNAVSLLGHRPAKDIAATCGYSDQPHFNHDVRQLTGRTPAQLIAPTSGL
jgi:AraC-like DNA-binding protein